MDTTHGDTVHRRARSSPGDRRHWWRRPWSTVKYHALDPVYAHLRARARRSELLPVTVRTALADARIVVLLIVNNERTRIPFFLRYYRDLGADHFVVVDNRSDDGLADLLAGETDVSLFVADGDYAAARYGADWANRLLSRHCVGKWVLWLDADEHLVFSSRPEALLPDLTAALEQRGRASLQSVMVDMYSDRAPGENLLVEGQDPLEVCDLFDSTGYLRIANHVTGTTWIKGGVRGRLFFRDAHAGPALNKTPLVRWRRHFAFLKGAHEVWPAAVNGRGSVNGALLHFKFTSVAVDAVLDPRNRAQHTGEYSSYDDIAWVRCRHPEVTRRYRRAADLVRHELFDPVL